MDGKTLRLSADKSTVSLSSPSISDGQKWELTQGKSAYTLKNVKTGTYLSYENDTLVMAASSEESGVTEWQPVAVANSADDWTLRGVIYPTKDNILVAKNSSFPVRGVISCSSPITSVNITIAKESGAVVISKNASPNAMSYDLKKLDDSVAYSSLAAGNYTFTLTAVSNSKSFELAKSSFTVRQQQRSGPRRRDLHHHLRSQRRYAERAARPRPSRWVISSTASCPPPARRLLLYRLVHGEGGRRADLLRHQDHRFRPDAVRPVRGCVHLHLP